MRMSHSVLLHAVPSCVWACGQVPPLPTSGVLNLPNRIASNIFRRKTGKAQQIQERWEELAGYLTSVIRHVVDAQSKDGFLLVEEFLELEPLEINAPMTFEAGGSNLAPVGESEGSSGGSAASGPVAAAGRGSAAAMTVSTLAPTTTSEEVGQLRVLVQNLRAEMEQIRAKASAAHVTSVISDLRSQLQASEKRRMETETSLREMTRHAAEVETNAEVAETKLLQDLENLKRVSEKAAAAAAAEAAATASEAEERHQLMLATLQQRLDASEQHNRQLQEAAIIAEKVHATAMKNAAASQSAALTATRRAEALADSRKRSLDDALQQLAHWKQQCTNHETERKAELELARARDADLAKTKQDLNEARTAITAMELRYRGQLAQLLANQSSLEDEVLFLRETSSIVVAPAIPAAASQTQFSQLQDPRPSPLRKAASTPRFTLQVAPVQVDLPMVTAETTLPAHGDDNVTTKLQAGVQPTIGCRAADEEQAKLCSTTVQQSATPEATDAAIEVSNPAQHSPSSQNGGQLVDLSSEGAVPPEVADSHQASDADDDPVCHQEVSESAANNKEPSADDRPDTREVCKHWQRFGRCRYNDECHFRHVSPTSGDTNLAAGTKVDGSPAHIRSLPNVHKHALGPDSARSRKRFFCDVCGRKARERYRCVDGCDFDVCIPCLNKAEEQDSAAQKALVEKDLSASETGKSKFAEEAPVPNESDRTAALSSGSVQAEESHNTSACQNDSRGATVSPAVASVTLTSKSPALNAETASDIVVACQTSPMGRAVQHSNANKTPLASHDQEATNKKKHQLRGQLLAFYLRHNPDKVADVDDLLVRYRGREAEMFAVLKRKYGVS